RGGLPQGSEVRGFALYVGLTEEDASNPALAHIVSQIKALVGQLAPTAETYASVALAPEGAGGRNVDVVRLALGDPAAQAKLREQQAPTPDEEEQDLARSGVVVDLSRKRLLLDNHPVTLTYREFELLQYFVLREGRTVDRQEIITTLWQDAAEEEVPSERTIDVHVRRLRVKLAHYQDIIRTVRGIGYRFDRHADVRILHSATPSPDLF
ncbi:winged helix-turn-helix domain-containing protein, partial [Leucobacter sp. M11]|uniref:winged helix-turn-helix domain-containing protein n=1 Tax=Leucobacter sp. M11 TaxID=2993565 RepID=UPI002D7F7A3B